MTCIIAHKDGWMVADKRVAFNNWIGPFEHHKITAVDPRDFARHSALIGTSGRADLPMVLDKLDIHAHTSVAKCLSYLLVDTFKYADMKLGEFLVLQSKPSGNTLHNVADNGASNEVLYSHYAIGSGYQFALGYLGGIRRNGHKVTTCDAKAAIAFASKFDLNVSEDSTVEWLGGVETFTCGRIGCEYCRF